MIKPVRLQLSRAKGFSLQELSRATNGLEAVNCARPSRLGNPFIVGIDGTRTECCEYYAYLLNGLLCLSCEAEVELQRKVMRHTWKMLPMLKGKNLACYCKFDGKPCHAGILLVVANLSQRRYAAADLKNPAGLMRAASSPNVLLELANA